MASGMIDEVCRSHASRFVNPATQPLLQKMEESTRDQFLKELSNLFANAGHLSFRLWTQRPSIALRDLSNLPTRTFNANSEYLEAHALHKHDDPKDPRLDGMKTKVVVHPAVLAYGTHDAEQYDQSRIWAKAVVWLETPLAKRQGQ